VRFNTLGRTDIVASAIGFGCWALGDERTWGPQDEKESHAAIRAALDLGINLFDTAESYGRGRSEEVLGRGLAGRRREAIIATKFSGGQETPDAIRTACEGSLRRLRTDVIDLYQAHWPPARMPLSDMFEALERLREQGKIRAWGVCNFGAKDLDRALETGLPIHTDQLPYSLLWRAIEFEILDLCREKGITVLAYSPLMQGLLTGKYASPDEVPPERARTRHFASSRPLARHGEPGCEEETFAALKRIRDISADLHEPMNRVAIAWLLAQPAVGSVLVGIRSPEQARENAAAASLVLPPDTVRNLTEATDKLKELLGANPDMWQSESRIR